MSPKSNPLTEQFLTQVTLLDEDENSFKHYGVMGMKWGVRKSRVSKGRKSKSNSTSNKSTTSQKTTGNKPNTLSNNPGNAKLTTQQLQSRINRLRLEKELGQLTNKPVSDTVNTQQLQEQITQIKLQRELQQLLAPPTAPVTPVSWQKQLVKSMPERLTKAAVDVSIGLGKKYLEQALKIKIDGRVSEPYRIAKLGNKGENK